MMLSKNPAQTILAWGLTLPCVDSMSCPSGSRQAVRDRREVEHTRLEENNLDNILARFQAHEPKIENKFVHLQNILDVFSSVSDIAINPDMKTKDILQVAGFQLGSTACMDLPERVGDCPNEMMFEKIFVAYRKASKLPQEKKLRKYNSDEAVTEYIGDNIEACVPSACLSATSAAPMSSASNVVALTQIASCATNEPARKLTRFDSSEAISKFLSE